MTSPDRTPSDERAIARAVQAWFARAARPLPWRTPGRRDPWASLVSEVMAQQTQISRVVERYPPFIARFPTPAALAAADESEVMRLWRGMGYYRRARLLHEAARAIVGWHGGSVPRSAAALRTLPGVGRYTAGAVASIALGQPEPIVDGNVARVLLRLHARGGSADEPRNARWCWERAAGLVHAADDPAAFNEGLMEIGATVCVPRSPVCAECPLARFCAARRLDRQHAIPAPKRRAAVATVHACVLIARDRRGRVLVEPRAARGVMWAGLWQLPTLESPSPPTLHAIREWAGGPVGRPITRFAHKTTHRLFEFHVRAAACDDRRAEAMPTLHGASGRRWMHPGAAADLPLSSPQRRILESMPATPPGDPPSDPATRSAGRAR